MDQLSQRSSSDRTQFMSRDDLDQEGSLDLEHDQYHYHDQDQNQSTDQELDPHEDDDQDEVHRGSNMSAPGRTIELKVRDQRAEPQCVDRVESLSISSAAALHIHIPARNTKIISIFQQKRKVSSSFLLSHSFSFQTNKPDFYFFDFFIPLFSADASQYDSSPSCIS